MRRTYLEVVKSVLSDADCDPVDSLDESTEAQQVLSVMYDVYANFTTRNDWQWQRKVLPLQAVSDVTRPVYLRTPQEAHELLWFTYNIKDDDKDKDCFVELTFLHADEFCRRANQLDSTAANVETIKTMSNGSLNIINDKHPQFWTSFDDDFIVCDSYDKSVSTTLVASRTQCAIQEAAIWIPADDTFPPIPAEMFPGFEAEVKMSAMPVLRQTRNVVAEATARRQRIIMSQKGWKNSSPYDYPNYGRKR